MPIKKSPGEKTPEKPTPKTKPEKEVTKKKAPTKKTAKKKPPKKEEKPKVWAHGNKKDPKTWLTLQQEKFVRIYCGIEPGYWYSTWEDCLTHERTNCMGNATLSYLNAYPDSSYHSARSSSSDLLANPSIKDRIKDTLELAGWSTDNAKLQHLSVMNQSWELPSKMRAVELFYKVTWELPDEKKLTLELSDDDRESIEAILAWRKKTVEAIADEIITSPSDLSDYPSTHDKWESD